MFILLIGMLRVTDNTEDRGRLIVSELEIYLLSASGIAHMKQCDRNYSGEKYVTLKSYDALREQLAEAQRELDSFLHPPKAVPNPCSVCDFPIFGSTIGTGDGSMKDGGSFAHPECYWEQRATLAESRLAERTEEAARVCDKSLVPFAWELARRIRALPGAKGG